MRGSTWALIGLLAVLCGHEPWLLDVAFAGVAAVLAEPAAVATIAAGIVVHRVRNRRLA